MTLLVFKIVWLAWLVEVIHYSSPGTVYSLSSAYHCAQTLAIAGHSILPDRSTLIQVFLRVVAALFYFSVRH